MRRPARSRRRWWLPPARRGTVGLPRVPHCGSTDAEVPTFTWWGGLVGHKLLSHVICRNCRRGYNGKTGRSNTANIIAYQAVALVLVVGLLALFWLLSDG